MTTPEEAANDIWQGWQQGQYYPEALLDQLTMEAGYQTQQLLLEKHLEAGEKQAGWKIGLTADAVRTMFNADAPVFAYLLESTRFNSGHAFDMNSLINPALESELCLTLAKPLEGNNLGAKDVLNALATVTPAFEVIEMRGDMATHLELGVADGVSHKAWVLGKAMPFPKDADPGMITAEIYRNGEMEVRALGAEVIDNQLESVAWLAGELAKLGKHLEAGQQIMTGSFGRPVPITKGDAWETRFSDLGNVEIRF